MQMSLPQDEDDTSGLDREYSPSRWTHRHISPDDIVAEHIVTLSAVSEQARRDLFTIRDVQYGSTLKDSFDIYSKGPMIKSGSPLVVYIHGGYWQALDKAQSGFLAPFICNDQTHAVLAAVGYVLATETQFADLTSMTSRCAELKSALIALVALGKTWDCSFSGVYLCGHSAGGHLVAAVLSRDYGMDASEIFKSLKGVWLCSGIFDLEPISHTYVNDPMKLTEEEILKCSPTNSVTKLDSNLKFAKDAVVNIIFAENDSPAFKKQSWDYYNKLKEEQSRHNDHTYRIEPPVQVPERDHFDLIHDLAHGRNFLLQEITATLLRNRTDSSTLSNVDLRIAIGKVTYLKSQSKSQFFE